MRKNKMFFKKKKNKRGITTIDDCKKFHEENPEYRYAILYGEERIPGTICKTYDDALKAMDIDEWYLYEIIPPVEIVDLLFM